MIEQCECGGAICPHGLCTRCQWCPNCGAGGRAYYEEQLAESMENASSDANREMLGDDAAFFEGEDVGNR